MVVDVDDSELPEYELGHWARIRNESCDPDQSLSWQAGWCDADRTLRALTSPEGEPCPVCAAGEPCVVCPDGMRILSLISRELNAPLMR